jgi:thiol:disulfide interchange protein DsbD
LLAQTAPAHAAISLIAEDVSLQPGRTQWIGLLFEMEPGWHVYWVNPGDAGDPPRPTIRWPVPTRLVIGPVVDYGYEGRVLLALPLDVPAGFTPSATVSLSADLRYLICRDVCIPGRTKVSLPTLLSGDAAKSAGRRDLFTETRARWPKTMPATWSVSATTDGRQITVSLQTGTSESAVTFYPLEADQIDNVAPQAVTPTARGAQITLQRTDPDAPLPPLLKGVVVLGKDRAYEIAPALSGSSRR